MAHRTYSKWSSSLLLRSWVYTSGACSLELARALAAAQRSPELVRRGDYHGPTWIRLPAMRLY